MGIAAVNTGNNLIYLLVASLLSLLAVSGFFGRYNLKKLRISFRVPDELYAGSDTPLFIRLHNDRRRFPAFLLQAPGRNREIYFPFISAGGFAAAIYDWRSGERGLQPLPTLSLSSPFPFNFFIRYKETPPAGQQAVVFPAPRRGHFPEEALHAGKEQRESNRDEKGFEGEIVSIRDYQPGDPLRFVSWKASARTGKLKTKEFGITTAAPLLLDIDLLPGRDVEAKLSHLCFLIKESMADMRPVGLKLTGQIYHPGQTREHKLKMLRALATYGRA